MNYLSLTFKGFISYKINEGLKGTEARERINVLQQKISGKRKQISIEKDANKKTARNENKGL